jgi:hypothetical protein
LARTKTARVAGRLVNANGQPTTGGTVQLLPRASSSAATIVPAGARITDDGQFEFPNVPAGDYVIQAYQGRKNSSTEGQFGALPVSVRTSDVTDLVVSQSPGSSISGRITLENTRGGAPPNLSRLEIVPAPADIDLTPTSIARAALHNDTTFEVNGISGPRRIRVMRLPQGWALKQVLVHNADVTDRPMIFGQPNQSLADVEIVLTDRITDVTGTLTDANGRRVAGHVLLFATDRRLWYPWSRFLNVVTARDDGTFTIAGAPPGPYYAVALTDLPADGDDAWQDPPFLAGLVPTASDVGIQEGQHYVLDLRVASTRPPR